MQSCSPPHEETDTELQPNEGMDGRQHLQYINAKAISEIIKLSKQKGFHAMALSNVTILPNVYILNKAAIILYKKK